MSRKFTLPLAVVAGFAVPVTRSYDAFKASGLNGASGELSRGLTGYDPYAQNWQLSRLKNGLLPIAMGVLGHKVAGMLGINRLLAQARIPIIRI